MRQSRPELTQVQATRGRPFQNGNPGRKPGSKNRTTLVAAALLESEAEELVRKAVELAKAGDVVMLKFLVGRILPRERLIKLDLPRMELADDVVVGTRLRYARRVGRKALPPNSFPRTFYSTFSCAY